MSCDCNCGCDNKYVNGGLLCHPLVVKVSYPPKVEITCVQYHVDHSSKISANIKSTKNCSRLSSNHRDGEDTYIFGINAPSNGDKCNKSVSDNARIEIRVTSPIFGWHGDGEDAKEFPTWDGSNPDVEIRVDARRKNFSDSDSYSFEKMSNANIESHLGQVRAGIFVITVDTAENVSVMSMTEEIGENRFGDE